MASDMNGFPKVNLLGNIIFDPATNSIYVENNTEGMVGGVLNQGQGFIGANATANKRGKYSTDLQSVRSLATQTSSGDFSFNGGSSASATGSHSFAYGNGSVSSGSNSVAMGFLNTASNAYAISFGYQSVASGNSSFAAGSSAVASGAGAIALGGGCTSSGSFSVVTGSGASSFSCYGRRAHSSGAIAVVGDNQASRFGLKGSTTDAIPLVLSADILAASTANQVTLQNNNALAFTGMIVVKQSGSVVSSSWKIEGHIVRGTNAAATTLVASTITAISNPTAIPGPALTANTTLGCLTVTVTGVAATNLRWSCYIDTVEIIYA